MKSLFEIFQHDLTLHCDKYLPYFSVYEQFFSKYRGCDLTFIEVGVQGGGSLEMWRKYFGSTARIIGIDVDPTVLERKAPDVEIFIGNQEDPAFWAGFLPNVGPIDAFLDDGGHTMNQQINTLLSVWPKISIGGVYMIEDTHTSYFKDWGNGLYQSNTIIEFTKRISDLVNVNHWQEPPPDHNIFKFSDLASIHYYNSMIVMTKGQIPWIRPNPYPDATEGSL
jgi:hypothetical protein